MTEMILEVQTLPEAVISQIHTKMVRVREENGSFLLTPVAENEKSFERLAGMFSDGRLSIDNFLKEKRIDKELED